MNIKPRGKRILVKRDNTKTISDIGTIDPNEEEKCYGEVVAVGNLDDISVGDTVVFGAFSGDIIKHDGQEYFMLNDEHGDVIGVMYD